VSDVSTQEPEWLERIVRFTAAEVMERVNELADDEGLVDEAQPYTNTKRIGRILDRLRIPKERDSDKKRTRQRIISRRDALNLLRAYGLSDVLEPPKTAQNKTSDTSTNVRNVRDEHEQAPLGWVRDATKRPPNTPNGCSDCGKPCGSTSRSSSCAAGVTRFRVCQRCHEGLATEESIRLGICLRCRERGVA
jgi:hypothetical protein